jgi:phospholipid/cholesterol/gamma-HCH transport system permease protein
VAIIVALPMLVMFSILVSWLGGAVMAALTPKIDIPFQMFFGTMPDFVGLKEVTHGVFKSFFFAWIVGIVSCHQGLITRGGPRGIGRSVTKAVVNSIVLIVLFDFVLTRILLH